MTDFEHRDFSFSILIVLLCAGLTILAILFQNIISAFCAGLIFKYSCHIFEDMFTKRGESK